MKRASLGAALLLSALLAHDATAQEIGDPEPIAEAPDAEAPPEVVAPPEEETQEPGSQQDEVVTQGPTADSAPETSDVDGEQTPNEVAPGPTSLPESDQTRVDEFITRVRDIPDSPATFALGVSSDTIVRAGSFRELGAQIVSALSPSGTLLSGVALEVAPWALRETRDDHALRTLRFSLATAGGTDAAGAPMDVQAAVGVRWSWQERPALSNKVLSLASRILAAHGSDEPLEPGTERRPVTLADLTPGEKADLQTLYEEVANIDTGARIELAATTVFDADFGEWRSARGWLTFDFRSERGSKEERETLTGLPDPDDNYEESWDIGAAIDASVADGALAGVEDDLLYTISAGAFFEVDTRHIDVHLQAGYRYVSSTAAGAAEDVDHQGLFGANISIPIRTSAVRVGVTGSVGTIEDFCARLTLGLAFAGQEHILYDTSPAAATSTASNTNN